MRASEILAAFLGAVAAKAGEYVAWHASEAVTRRRKDGERQRKRWARLMREAKAGTWPPNKGTGP